MKASIVRFLSTFTVLFSLLFASNAWAESAESFVKARQAELTTILNKGDGAATNKEVATVFDRMLDYDKLAEESLKDYWGERSDAEKAEFKGILTQLVQRAYKKNLRSTLNYEVTFKGEEDAKNGSLVETVAHHKTDKRQEPIRVDYVLHQKAGQWRVYDIVTEGSSLVKNYRSQFRRIIEKKGFADLISRMKKKLAEE